MARWLVIWLIGWGSIASAQDMHWSQWLRQPLWNNPASAGVMRADIRTAASYRHQWQSVPVPYMSTMVGHDQKTTLLPTRIGTLSLGGIAAYDIAGDAGLRWLLAGVTVSYQRSITDNHRISIGLTGYGLQRAFRPARLSFGNQYSGTQFDPGAPTGEVYESRIANTWSAGIGALYSGNASDERHSWQAGIAMFNMPPPTYHFTSLALQPTPEVLPRLNLHTAVNIAAGPRATIQTELMYQRQGRYSEWLSTVAMRYSLSNTPAKQTYLRIGTGYRLGDALFPTLELGYNQWSVGLSFDVNTSPLQAATNRRGGPEISLWHLITRPKPPKTFKSCPIF